MTDPFLAEIRMFAGNYAPYGWALCNGQLMAISQNTALFSLLGTTYGGNGISTFGLPDLRGAAPMQAGQGAGLSQRFLGENGGEPTVTLSTSEMPMHVHLPNAVAASADTDSASSTTWATAGGGRLGSPMYSTNAPTQLMNPMTVGMTGNNQPHNNMPPYLCVSFIIALQGIFPQRP